MDEHDSMACAARQEDQSAEVEDGRDDGATHLDFLVQTAWRNKQRFEPSVGRPERGFDCTHTIWRSSLSSMLISAAEILARVEVFAAAIS